MAARRLLEPCWVTAVQGGADKTCYERAVALEIEADTVSQLLGKTRWCHFRKKTCYVPTVGIVSSNRKPLISTYHNARDRQAGIHWKLQNDRDNKTK